MTSRIINILNDYFLSKQHDACIQKLFLIECLSFRIIRNEYKFLFRLFYVWSLQQTQLCWRLTATNYVILCIFNNYLLVVDSIMLYQIFIWISLNTVSHVINIMIELITVLSKERFNMSSIYIFQLICMVPLQQLYYINWGKWWCFQSLWIITWAATLICSNTKNVIVNSWNLYPR